MEQDLKIELKGLGERIGLQIGNTLAEVLKAFDQAETNLDLRRVHRVIVTADFGKEIAEFAPKTASGNTISYTNESYGVAVGKILLLPRGDELEIVPVFDANMLIGFLEDPKSEAFKMALHLLHHELCHVHDDNKKIDALPGILLKHRFDGKEMIIRPLAEACWSEYVANRLSSCSAPEESVLLMTNSLTDAIIRTKPEIDREIIAYRHHAKLDDLLMIFQRHGEFLVKAASYVLGYIDGLATPLQILSPIAFQRLSGSYFAPTWAAMHSALQEMWDIYPNQWKSLSVYDQLASSLENYYDIMGLQLSTTPDRRAYIHVPFRPETLPFRITQ